MRLFIHRSIFSILLKTRIYLSKNKLCLHLVVVVVVDFIYAPYLNLSRDDVYIHTHTVVLETDLFRN